MMAKESLKYYPLLGQYLSAANVVLINRKDRSSAIETMKKAADVMIKDNVSI